PAFREAVTELSDARKAFTTKYRWNDEQKPVREQLGLVYDYTPHVSVDGALSALGTDPEGAIRNMRSDAQKINKHLGIGVAPAAPTPAPAAAPAPASSAPSGPASPPPAPAPSRPVVRSRADDAALDQLLQGAGVTAPAKRSVPAPAPAAEKR